MPVLDYAFASGWNVALASLNNVQNHLGSRNRRETGARLIPVAIRASLIDPFPVRRNPLDGGETGDGFVNQDWLLSLTTYGLDFLVNTYWTNETVVSAPFTIYTRKHIHGTFARYNCYGILPSAANGDIAFMRDPYFDGTFNVRVRWRDLIAI